MADNLTADPGTGGGVFATDDITGVHWPFAKLAFGPRDTANEVDDASAKRLPVKVGDALPAGTNNIGDVDVLTLPALPAGTNNIGDVDVLTLPALPAGTNNIGDVDVLTIAAGDNNIGNVDVVSLPALVAGTANIGDVDVLTLPALVAGTANIGDVDVLTLPALPAGTNNIGDVDVLTLPALVAGTANIGDVDVLTLPALPTGTNSIGRVNPEPQTANGLTISRVLSAASTNATSVKASAGQVYTVYAHNINAAVRYLKLYNKASAPTVGTDTPVLTIPIPGNTAGAGAVLDTGGMGIAFGTGIALAITTGVADADTGAVSSQRNRDQPTL